ncbi:MAG: hypothetical protein ABI690_19080 [Chloroflexota bacterium]
MIHISAAPEDAALANRLKTDLQQAGFTVSDDAPRAAGDVLIAVVSPTAWMNVSLQGDVIRALDSSRHVIPVLTGAAKLPKLIVHLTSIDFSTSYPFDKLKTEVDRLSAPDAPSPMRVLTPAVKGRNNRIGYWLFILVIVWFVVGIILVGVFRIQAPTDEYNSVATFAQATINIYVGANLPHSTLEAENFPATLQAAPTAQQPLLIATTTAMAAGPATKSPGGSSYGEDSDFGF